MKIQEVKVEAVDEAGGFVLKRVVADNGTFLNRKIAVPHTIYLCEQKRTKLSHPVLDSPIQTKHIEWDKNDEEWNFKGVKKSRKKQKLIIDYSFHSTR